MHLSACLQVNKSKSLQQLLKLPALVDLGADEHEIYGGCPKDDEGYNRYEPEDPEKDPEFDDFRAMLAELCASSKSASRNLIVKRNADSRARGPELQLFSTYD